jgi:hypothetical protein
VVTHCGDTASDAVAGWFRLPLVPVIVMVDVPAGVELMVEMVSVEEPEPPLMDDGLKVAAAPEGKPLALNDTTPVKPLSGLIVTV